VSDRSSEIFEIQRAPGVAPSAGAALFLISPQASFITDGQRSSIATTSNAD
jgi:hypothetical protein